MERTQNSEDYRQEIENTTNIRKRKGRNQPDDPNSIEYSDRYDEWRKEDPNMLPFNILAKCAAKELKYLVGKSPRREHSSESLVTTSDDESDIGDIEFPYSFSGDRKVYKCTFDGCKKEFPSLSRMRRHYIIHTGAKPFKCLNAKCTKSFSRRDNMIQHYKGHCVHTKI